MQINPNWPSSLLDPKPQGDGTARRTVTMVACPQCGSLRVREHDNGISEHMVRWACQCCGTGWKEPAGIKVERGYAIVVVSF